MEEKQADHSRSLHDFIPIARKDHLFHPNLVNVAQFYTHVLLLKAFFFVVCRFHLHSLRFIILCIILIELFQNTPRYFEQYNSQSS